MRRLFLVALLILPTCLQAQTSTAPDSVKSDSLPAPKVDTVLFVPKLDTAREVAVTDTFNFEKRLTQNPTRALFKSLVVPGWGQMGNHRYFKAALFAGLEIWFASQAIHYGSQANVWKARYNNATDLGDRNTYHAIYGSYYGTRSKYIWYTGIAAFVSIFDAYVDAHLSGEPVRAKEQKIDLSLVPSGGDGFSAQISLSF